MRFFAVFLLFVVLLPVGPQAVVAQSVPAGACLLPDNQWCWPIAPLTYGDPCECQLPDGGVAYGIVQ